MMAGNTIGIKYRTIVMTIVFVMTTVLVAGCSGSDSGKTEVTVADTVESSTGAPVEEAKRNDATTVNAEEESADAAGSAGNTAGADNAGGADSADNAGGADSADNAGGAGSADNAVQRTEFGGISFVLPVGWIASATNQKMKIEAPGNNDVQAIMSVIHEDVTVPTGTEEESLKVYTESYIKGLSLQGFVLAYEHATTKAIDGRPAEIVTFTMGPDSANISTYVLAVMVDDGVTNMMLGSANGVYDDEFETIISSVKIV